MCYGACHQAWRPFDCTVQTLEARYARTDNAAHTDNSLIMIHLSVRIRTDNSLEISHLSVQIYTDSNIERLLARVYRFFAILQHLKSMYFHLIGLSSADPDQDLRPGSG